VRFEARAADLAAKDRQLTAEYENLELLRLIAAADEHDELQQTADDDVTSLTRAKATSSRRGTPTLPPAHNPRRLT
jgi:hypothetical protein